MVSVPHTQGCGTHMNKRPPTIHDDQSPAPDPLRFPTPKDEGNSQPALRLAGEEHPTREVEANDGELRGDVLARFADVSRHIHDLARDLECPNGLNDDDRHRPRAA